MNSYVRGVLATGKCRWIVRKEVIQHPNASCKLVFVDGAVLVGVPLVIRSLSNAHSRRFPGTDG